MPGENNETANINLNRPEDGYNKKDPSWNELYNQNARIIDDYLSGNKTVSQFDATQGSVDTLTTEKSSGPVRVTKLVIEATVSQTIDADEHQQLLLGPDQQYQIDGSLTVNGSGIVTQF